MDTTAWLIETTDPVSTVLYFCNEGDWCSNPNHAHRFPSAEQASMKLASMQLSQNFRVAEHMWCD